MRVLYFAQARLAVGRSEETLEPPAPLSAEDLWKELIQRHRGLSHLRPSCRLARNGKFIGPDEKLLREDEIAVLPPVTGG